MNISISYAQGCVSHAAGKCVLEKIMEEVHKQEEEKGKEENNHNWPQLTHITKLHEQEDPAWSGLDYNLVLNISALERQI